MDHIEFVDPCHVDAVFYPRGTVVPEKSLRKDWVEGALDQRFVRRVEAPAKAKPVEPPKV